MSAAEKESPKYEILRVVNRGGMGEIALGRMSGTKGFEKLVILKRLRADAERDDHRAMFDIEAELMSRIEHPNIVQVFDQPVIDGTPYLAMAYVRGRNLDQIVRKARAGGETVPVHFSLSVIAEVLRGLAFIHRLKDADGRALGVVHQDITPSNILVSFFGEVKITDFGIAYVTSRDGGLRRGVLKGKPRYVAPEVLAGRRVNNRVDMYGVGVVLYELLKGRALFARPKVQDTLTAVAKNDLPDFATDIPNAPSGVHELLRNALAKDPSDRFRTAEEMSLIVHRELAALGGPMSPARLGHALRDWFRGDQDTPDQEDDSEAHAVPVFPPAFRGADLEQTLSELDKLLGAESSSDLFALPPEIAKELQDIDDMEPFDAMTPLPDLALAGPDAEALLLSAHDPITAPSIPAPVSNVIPAPVGLRPPRGLAGDDPRTDPSLVPTPRRTRPPMGKAINGSEPINDDIVSQRPRSAVPERAAEGFGTGDLETPLSRRTQPPGVSTGEYSFASGRSKPQRRGSVDLVELTPSQGYVALPGPDSGGDDEATVDAAEPVAARAPAPAPALAEPLDEDTGVTSIASDGPPRDRRAGMFAIGLMVGVILGAALGAVAVLQILR